MVLRCRDLGFLAAQLLIRQCRVGWSWGVNAGMLGLGRLDRGELGGLTPPGGKRWDGCGGGCCGMWFEKGVGARAAPRFSSMTG